MRICKRREDFRLFEPDNKLTTFVVNARCGMRRGLARIEKRKHHRRAVDWRPIFDRLARVYLRSYVSQISRPAGGIHDHRGDGFFCSTRGAVMSRVPLRAYGPRSLEYQIFCISLQEMRKQAGFTPTALAKRLGTTKSFVASVENGATRLDFLQMREWCGSCKSTVAELAAVFETRLARSRDMKASRLTSAVEN